MQVDCSAGRDEKQSPQDVGKSRVHAKLVRVDCQALQTRAGLSVPSTVITCNSTQWQPVPERACKRTEWTFYVKQLRNLVLLLQHLDRVVKPEPSRCGMS